MPLASTSGKVIRGLSEDVLLKASARASAVGQIIFGFVGGTFTADGMTVRVDGVQAKKSVIDTVKFAVLDADGEVMNRPPPLPIQGKG